MLLSIIQVSSVILIEYKQHRKNITLVPTLKQDVQRSTTVVIYFSRSGNTEVMAYTIAEVKRGKLMNLVADDYKIGFRGWINAMIDARKTTAVIKPQKVDLTEYDTVYIGAPIWLYGPAPPVFEFASKNDLTGKKVILFNSMNSKFEQKYIDTFKNMVKEKRGEFIKHLYVNRGRMSQQMSNQAFIDTVKAKILTKD